MTLALWRADTSVRGTSYQFVVPEPLLVMTLDIPTDSKRGGGRSRKTGGQEVNRGMIYTLLLFYFKCSINLSDENSGFVRIILAIFEKTIETSK